MIAFTRQPIGGREESRDGALSRGGNWRWLLQIGIAEKECFQELNTLRWNYFCAEGGKCKEGLINSGTLLRENNWGTFTFIFF